MILSLKLKEKSSLVLDIFSVFFFQFFLPLFSHVKVPIVGKIEKRGVL